MKAVIIMGSSKDLSYGKEIAEKLKFFEIESELRIASAHKTPERVLEILKKNEKDDVIFVTIAGRSNALSGFADANTTKPVIAAPPISNKFAGLDLLSSLNMPSGVAPMVVLYAENVALAVAKIFALKYDSVKSKLIEYQNVKRNEVIEADNKIYNSET